MRSILPASTPVEKRTEKIKEAVEWAWDMEKLEYKLRNGKMYTVIEDEAIKIWIWKVLITEKQKYIVYSPGYGDDVWQLIGRGFSHGFIELEAKRMMEEAILGNIGTYVKRLTDFKVDFKDHKLYIYFRANTIYNEGVEMNFAI